MFDQIASTSNVSAAENRPRWRPQMSLAMLLALITIAALSISHFLQSRKLNAEIEALQERCDVLNFEKIQWKAEAGVIEPVDLNMMHAIQLPTFEKDTFRYRLYLPPDKWYKISAVKESIPVSGVVATENAMVVEAVKKDEYDDEISVMFNEKSISVSYEIGTMSHQSSADYPPDRPSNFTSATEGVERGKLTIISAVGEPLVLMRKREYPDGNLVGTAKTGLLLWIEEVPDPHVSPPQVTPAPEANEKPGKM